MIGDQYWSVGITVFARDARSVGNKGIPGSLAWAGHLDFLDGGWVEDDSATTGTVVTQGRLTTRYHVDPVPGDLGTTALTAVIDALIADATKLGITFTRHPSTPPSVSYEGDGEWEDYPPPEGWREMLAEQNKRLGWRDYVTTQSE